MSSRVDRGTADGSLYRDMKERTKRHKATNWRVAAPTLTLRGHIAFMRHEVIVKQKASIPVANKRGRPCNSSSI